MGLKFNVEILSGNQEEDVLYIIAQLVWPEEFGLVRGFEQEYNGYRYFNR